MKNLIVLLTVGLLSSQNVFADGFEMTYISPNGVNEICRSLPQIPGGDYDKDDLDDEIEFCSANIYAPNFAVCPKTWSTSPATMVREISESGMTKEQYMSSEYCGKKNEGEGVDNLAKFKVSMNQGSSSLGGGTSGTYSPSSLAYYHISRFLDTKIKVPVSVYREMDRQYIYENVVPLGLENTRSGQKVRKGWKWLDIVGENPGDYSPTEELVTADGAKLFGVLIKGPGERYGAEINSTRTASWGTGQHKQMRADVAPFIALRINKPLLEAIEEGVEKAKASSREMANSLGEVPTLQMLFWMREMSEMIVLDSIFGQQDRVGNIDYRWYWNFETIDGKVKDKREKRDEFEEMSREEMASSGITLPEKDWVAEIKPGTEPVLIQRTFLNDNDAGLRDYSGYPGATIGKYANFPERADWLEDIHHMASKTYEKLMELDRDLQEAGPIYQWMAGNLNLNEKSLESFVERTHSVAEKLRAQCPEIQFDLNDVDNYPRDGVQMESIDCSAL